MQVLDYTTQNSYDSLLNYCGALVLHAMEIGLDLKCQSAF